MTFSLRVENVWTPKRELERSQTRRKKDQGCCVPGDAISTSSSSAISTVRCVAAVATLALLFARTGARSEGASSEISESVNALLSLFPLTNPAIPILALRVFRAPFPFPVRFFRRFGIGGTSVADEGELAA